MPLRLQAAAISARRAGSSIVPVGLAGLATTSPAIPAWRAASSICGARRHPARLLVRSPAARRSGRARSGYAGSRDSRATAARPWRPHRTGPGTPARSPPTSRSSPPPAPARPRPRSGQRSAARCARAARAIPEPRCNPASRARAPGWPRQGRRAAPACRAGRPPCGSPCAPAPRARQPPASRPSR